MQSINGNLILIAVVVGVVIALVLIGTAPLEAEDETIDPTRVEQLVDRSEEQVEQLEQLDEEVKRVEVQVEAQQTAIEIHKSMRKK